jgi:hypothetical protein
MKPSIKFGLIYAGISIGISLLSFGLGIEKDDSVQTATRWISMGIPAIIVFLGIRAQRDEFGSGYITFGKAFSTGFIISFIGSAIISVYTYLYFTILNPGMIEYIKLKQEEEMLNRGLSESQVEAMASQMETWSSPGMMSFFIILGGIILGAVISLICSAILKKENPADNF